MDCGCVIGISDHIDKELSSWTFLPETLVYICVQSLLYTDMIMFLVFWCCLVHLMLLFQFVCLLC